MLAQQRRRRLRPLVLLPALAPQLELLLLQARAQQPLLNAQALAERRPRSGLTGQAVDGLQMRRLVVMQQLGGRRRERAVRGAQPVA